MAEQSPQTLKNHVRYDPLFHYFMLPLSAALLIWSIAHMVRHMSHEAIAAVAGSLLIFLLMTKMRGYALRVQDRVIRLEETLRMSENGGVVPGLREGQIAALRFASDEELHPLAVKAAQENLAGKEIKQRIQNWRPDTFRV